MEKRYTYLVHQTHYVNYQAGMNKTKNKQTKTKQNKTKQNKTKQKLLSKNMNK